MNTNIEELYKKKYLKYKAKYFNIQRGGRFTQGRNHPNHIAFIDKDKLPKSIKVGGKAGFMALDDKGNIAVETNVNDVKIINLENGTEVKTYTTQSIVSGIAFDSDNFYIGDHLCIDYHVYHAKTYQKGELKVPTICKMLACNEGYVYILTNTNIYVYTKPSYPNSSTQILVITNPDINYSAASMAFDREGQIVVADSGNNRIQVIPKIKIDPTKNKEISLDSLDKKNFRYIGSNGKGPGQFTNLTDFAFNVHGHIIVADNGNNRVQILDYKTGVPIYYCKVKEPKGIVVDGNGRILVSTENTIRVLERSDFILFPEPQPYFIITSNIKNYQDYLQKYDPNIRVNSNHTLVSSYVIISYFNEQQTLSLMDKLKENFVNFTIEIVPKTQNIQISSTKIPLSDTHRTFLWELTNKYKEIINYKMETNYKYTVMTTAKDALRYLLTVGLANTDAKKQQTYQALLLENKLQPLKYEPPLPIYN
jgi:hypothetical protein